MLNHLRIWILIGFGALIIIGAGLILAPLLSPTGAPAIPTSLPTALIIDQSNLPYPQVPRIKVDDAHTAYEHNQAVIVDARSATQYARSHIAGAKSIPLNELESRLNELNKDQLIITYCTWPDEETSARAAQTLLDHGFRNVTAIQGGFQAWINAGYPTEP